MSAFALPAIGLGAQLLGGIMGGRSARRNFRNQQAELARRENQFRLDTQNQNRLADVYAQDSEGLAMGGRDAAAANLQRIFGRNLQAANQLSRASMAGLGYNSLLGNQLSANARRSAEQESGALSNLDQQFLDRRLALRGQANADRQNRFSNQNALQQAFNGQAVGLLGQAPGSTTASLLQGFGGMALSQARDNANLSALRDIFGGGSGVADAAANRERAALGDWGRVIGQNINTQGYIPAPINPYTPRQ